MQIVIDIPDTLFTKIQNGKADKRTLETVILHGTPLPKRHGRLIDADRLKSMYSINQANFNTVVGIQKWIENAPTIIEAESEV